MTGIVLDVGDIASYAALIDENHLFPHEIMRFDLAG
jgi:hypothetical protein